MNTFVKNQIIKTYSSKPLEKIADAVLKEYSIKRYGKVISTANVDALKELNEIVNAKAGFEERIQNLERQLERADKKQRIEIKGDIDYLKEQLKRTEDRLKEYRDLVEIAKDIRKDIINKLDQCSRHRQLFSEIASRRDQHFLSSQYFSGIESRFEGRLSEEQLEALRELHGGEHSAFRNALREAIRDATNNLSGPIKSHIERLDAEKEELKSQREELRSYRAGLEQEERNLEKILVKEYGTDADKRSYEIVTGKIDTLRVQMESLYKDLFDEKITKEEFDRKKEEIVARLQELGREKASVVAQAVKNFWNEVRDTRQAFINERDRLRESLYQGYFAKVLDELKNKEQVARKEFLNETR